jgi:hypothetical protein
MKSLILLILGSFIILVPLSYIDCFLIVELRRKLGYLRFAAIVFCYLILLAMIVVLLSGGVVSLLLAFIFAAIPDLWGLYYLRKEFVATVKKDLKLK